MVIVTHPQIRSYNALPLLIKRVYAILATHGLVKVSATVVTPTIWKAGGASAAESNLEPVLDASAPTFWDEVNSLVHPQLRPGVDPAASVPPAADAPGSLTFRALSGVLESGDRYGNTTGGTSASLGVPLAGQHQLFLVLPTLPPRALLPRRGFTPNGRPSECVRP